MVESPQGRKRSHSSTSDNSAVGHPTPELKSSPGKRHDSLPPHMPMPLYTGTAGILRTQSPLIGPHLLSSQQIPFGRTPTPLSRTVIGPPLYSYGASVGLDPASLSPIPDPVAIAEIKRVIPQVLVRAGMRDVYAMIEALRANDLRTGSTSVSALNKVQTPISDRMPQDGVFSDFAADAAGAAFDALLNNMTNEEIEELGVSEGDAEAKERRNA